MLRTGFHWERLENPVQTILGENKINLKYFDLSWGDEGEGETEGESKRRLRELKVEDRAGKFDLQEVPFRVTLCKIRDDKYEIIISNHHILY